MKILVLGDGSAGRRHAGHLANRGHEVKIAGPNEAHWIEGNWDARVIATPPEFHSSQIYYSKDWHLLCEGPCTYLPDPHPTAVRMMASNWRFVPALQGIKKEMTSPILAHFYFNYDLARWRAGIDYTKTCYYWSGHDLINVHEADLAFWFFGPAERISIEKIYTGKSRACDGFQMLIKHRSGVVTTISTSWHSAQYYRGLRIINNDSTMQEGCWTTPAHDPMVNQSYEAMINCWLDHIERGDPLVEPSLEDGYRVYKALQGEVW